MQRGRREPTSSPLLRLQLLVHRGPTASSTAEQAVERGTKVRLEDRVEDRVDGRVGVAEPEEDGVEASSDVARRAPAVDDIKREETEPSSTENGHYDGGSDRRPRLQVFGVTHSPPPAHHKHHSSRLLINYYKKAVYT